MIMILPYLSIYRPKIYNGEKGDPPALVDWRYADKNPAGVVGVTPIKNQGACGACYAFATVASMEGLVAADQGVLNELSNEQLIDVSKSEACYLCIDWHSSLVASLFCVVLTPFLPHLVLTTTTAV